jgi:hypothetical protein
MSGRFFIFNITHHNVQINLEHNHHMRWFLCKNHTYSLGLPIDANHQLTYKLKHNHKTIGKIWVNHNGFIVKIVNKSSRFIIMTNDFKMPCHFHNIHCGTPSIYITENGHNPHPHPHPHPHPRPTPTPTPLPTQIF